MSDIDQIFEAAVRLPQDQKAVLIARLLGSLDEDNKSNLDKAFREEISRRLAELDSGAVTAIPWKEARAIILENTV